MCIKVGKGVADMGKCSLVKLERVPCAACGIYDFHNLVGSDFCGAFTINNVQSL